MQFLFYDQTEPYKNLPHYVNLFLYCSAHHNIISVAILQHKSNCFPSLIQTGIIVSQQGLVKMIDKLEKFLKLWTAETVIKDKHLLTYNIIQHGSGFINVCYLIFIIPFRLSWFQSVEWLAHFCLHHHCLCHLN